jgi:nicotinic acid mononucleotide adenylyltransferase
VEGKIAVVTGDDLVDGFRDGKEPELLAARTDLIVVHRKSSDELPFAYHHRYVSNLLFHVSSRYIRSRIR